MVLIGAILDPVDQIREAIEHVSMLRAAQTADPVLYQALISVKRLQSARFRATHADMLCSQNYSAPCQFFLSELYSDKDYSDRDVQFSRVAGTLQRLFSKQLVETAVTMASLHQLTEDLDNAMAAEWSQLPSDCSASLRYVLAWRNVGLRDSRTTQLKMVLRLGRDLDQLTRSTGLRLALRLMRAPAAVAGLSALQLFLERGFDTFAAMGDAQVFLRTIKERETCWIAQLFDGKVSDCQTSLGSGLNA